MVKLKRILTSVLAGVMLLFSCAFVGCGEQVKEMPSGVFYTLKEAYENNYITRNDLLNIAYQYNGRNINEEFVVQPKEELLDETVENIRKDYYKLLSGDKISFESIYICEYYGIYGGNVAVRMGSYELPIDLFFHEQYKIDGVLFEDFCEFYIWVKTGS